MSKFKWLTGDTSFPDYGGKFYRKIDKRRYHIIELFDMVDACGKECEDQPWNVQLGEVDIDALPKELLNSAIKSWGAEDESLSELVLVECIFSYGSYAPLGQWNGKNYKKLMKEARQESYALDDPAKYACKMAGTVNKIGSTPREFMIGDFQSAMIRGIGAGDTGAKIMGKMHGFSEETIQKIEETKPSTQVNSMMVNLRKIPSDDPIAYMSGFQDGVNCRIMPAKKKELAKAYLEGYQFGSGVRARSEPWPDWAK